MCVVSMVSDHYLDKWRQGQAPALPVDFSKIPQWQGFLSNNNFPTKEEIAEFKALLIRAREYDKKNNEPSCQLAEKREKLKKILADAGEEIDKIFDE